MFLRRAVWISPFLLLAGCNQVPIEPAKSPAKTPPKSAAKTTVFQSPRDDLGRVIALKAPAQRAIVIGPGAIETVFAIGAGKQLVGRDDYADSPPAAKNVAVAGDYQGPSVEKSVALRPDLVIVQGETWDKARVEKWQSQIGVPVAALTATSVADVRRDFGKIGAWLGHPKEAQTLAKGLEIAAASEKNPPSAFFEVGRSPLYSAGTGTLSSDILRAGGFRNIAADVKGYQPFGLESLLARAPAVYVATSKKSRTQVLAELRADASLSKLKCVREGAVVVVNGDWVLRPGPRLKLGIAALRAEKKRIGS